MRILTLIGLSWLVLSVGVVARAGLGDGGASLFGADADSANEFVLDKAVNSAAAGETPKQAPAQEVRNPLDVGMDALPAERRRDIVEDVLLNGAAVRESAGDGDHVVTLWREARPYNVMVRFNRSWFRPAAPGVLGPFCGQRVGYELALFEGYAPTEGNMSQVHPVPFELACDRAERSRNAYSFREFAATLFLKGSWDFSFACGNEAYELTVDFPRGMLNAPSTVGRALRFSVDRIEEPSFRPVVTARRERDTGEIEFTFFEDDRGLHGVDRNFTLRSPSIASGAPALRGTVRHSEEGGAEQSCGGWAATKRPDAAQS